MTPSPSCPSIARTLRNWIHRHLSQLGSIFGHLMLDESSTMDFWGERARHDPQPELPQHSQNVEELDPPASVSTGVNFWSLDG